MWKKFLSFESPARIKFFPRSDIKASVGSMSDNVVEVGISVVQASADLAELGMAVDAGCHASRVKAGAARSKPKITMQLHRRTMGRPAHQIRTIRISQGRFQGLASRSHGLSYVSSSPWQLSYMSKATVGARCRPSGPRRRGLKKQV